MSTMKQQHENDAIRALDELELPELALPLHQQQLKRSLLRAHGARRKGFVEFIQEFVGGIVDMRRRTLWVAAPVIAVLVLVLTYTVALRPPRAMAFMTIQVNPSFELGLNQEQRVVSARGLDDEGKAILAAVDVRGQPLEQALTILIDRLVADNKVGAGGRVVMALRAADNGVTPVLPDVVTRARQIVTDRLAAAQVTAETVSVAVDSRLYRAAAEKGFMPAAYSELIPLGLSNETVLVVLALPRDLGVSDQAVRDERDTVARALRHLQRAGLSEQAAVAVMQAAIAADPSLEEIDTIARGFLDLQRAGISHEQGLAVLALQKDANLGLNPVIFLEEVDTLMDGVIELHRAGIGGALALDVIRAAAQANPLLEEVDTVVRAMRRLTSDGLAPDAALARIREALAADPTMDEFEHILGVDDNGPVSDETVQQAVALAKELGVAEPVLRDELDTLAEALRDLQRAGLSEQSVLAVIEAAVEADPSLEELDTIVSGIIDLHRAGIPYGQGLAILALQKDADLALVPVVFLEEVDTLMDGLIELHRAEIGGALALEVIRAAAQADPLLEEVDTVVEAMIRLTADGLAPVEALARIKAALAADPTMDEFEYLLGIEAREPNDDDDMAEAPNDDDDMLEMPNDDDDMAEAPDDDDDDMLELPNDDGMPEAPDDDRPDGYDDEDDDYDATDGKVALETLDELTVEE